MSKQEDSGDQQSELNQFTQLAKKIFSSKIEGKDKNKKATNSSHRIRLVRKETS